LDALGPFGPTGKGKAAEISREAQAAADDDLLMRPFTTEPLA
jgi:hypothetical protein